jgi:hypothetical protein
MQKYFDKAFFFLYDLAYKIADSKYVELLGVQDVNPFILLACVVFGVYAIFYGIYKVIKWNKFKSDKREAIKQKRIIEEIKKEEEILEIKRRNKELLELKDVLNRETVPQTNVGITKEDLVGLIAELKQSKEPEVIIKEVPVEKEVIKEVIKEVPAKEPKGKTKYEVKTNVKEINITIPKFNFKKEEGEEEPTEVYLPESVLEKDSVTSTENDRVIISDAYQEEIEKAAEEVEIIEETTPEPFEEKVTEIPSEEIKEEIIETKEEDLDPLEALRLRNARAKAHKEEILKQLEGRA